MRRHEPVHLPREACFTGCCQAHHGTATAGPGSIRHRLGAGSVQVRSGLGAGRVQAGYGTPRQAPSPLTQHADPPVRSGIGDGLGGKPTPAEECSGAWGRLGCGVRTSPRLRRCHHGRSRMRTQSSLSTAKGRIVDRVTRRRSTGYGPVMLPKGVDRHAGEFSDHVDRASSGFGRDRSAGEGRASRARGVPSDRLSCTGCG
jgi:hypothetical protein